MKHTNVHKCNNDRGYNALYRQNLCASKNWLPLVAIRLSTQLALSERIIPGKFRKHSIGLPDS